MRILFDFLVILICVFAPWTWSVAVIALGLILFDEWLEGLVFIVLLDILLFGGRVGKHTLYFMLCFFALYYVTMRFKLLLRV